MSRRLETHEYEIAQLWYALEIIVEQLEDKYPALDALVLPATRLTMIENTHE